MKTLHFFISAFAGLILLSGCSTTSNTVIGDGYDTRVFYEDPVTERRVSITNVTDFRKDGLLRAVVTLKNNTHRNVLVQYHFQWYDSMGDLVMPNNDVYKTRLIQGKDAVPLSAVAPRQDVVEFKFKVSLVKRSERGPNSF